MNKRIGQDFEDLMKEARENPEVQAYLDSFSVIIGNMVYARRMQLNLSQQELAERAETTQKRISLLEAAKGNVGQDILDRVFRELKLKSMNAEFDELSAARA